MATWGVAAMLGTLRGGGLADRLGSRRIINSALGLLALDFALMPWAAASFAGAALALAFWGACGWGFVVAQQHRLVGIAPSLAAIVLALNASAIYLAVSASGAAGAVILMHVDPHRLPLLGSALLLGAAALAELAHRSIDTHAAPGVSASSAK
jgi:predicted MFS family arabinose efflux permease